MSRIVRLANFVSARSGVLEVMARPEPDRRRAARDRAAQFGWPASVAGMLRAHGLAGVVAWQPG